MDKAPKKSDKQKNSDDNKKQEKTTELNDGQNTIRIRGIRLRRESGILWPCFWPRDSTFGLEDSTTWAEWLEEASNFKVRPDDIFIDSYVKAGQHWMYEIVNQLVPGLNGKTTSTNKYGSFFELHRASVFDAIPSPRLIVTHLPFQFMPKEAFKKPCKHICVVRNPKDTAVSLYHHTKGIKLLDYDGTFSDFYESFINGEVEDSSWFDHVTGWWKGTKDNTNVLWIHYENLNKNPISTLKKIASFLGCSADGEFLQRIAEKTSFKNMKQESDKFDLRVIWKTKDGTMFRKGQVGNWREYFTVAQNERFDKVYEDKMADCPELKLQIQFT